MAKESQEGAAASSADDKQVEEADGDKDLNPAATATAVPAEEKSKDGKFSVD